MLPVLLLLIVLMTSALQDGPSAVERFYEPGGTQTSSPHSEAAGIQLRPIPVVRPFPAYGNVGIHYWFQNDSGERLTEEQAAASQGAYSLHVRTNAEGFLSVWLSGETEPRQLTPGYGGYNGHMLPSGSDYTVPGPLRFGQNPAAGLIVVFSRSQTEQPADGQGAITRLQTISNRTAQDGLPQIVRDSDQRSPGQVGTYVVNRRGGPVAAEISLRSR